MSTQAAASQPFGVSLQVALAAAPAVGYGGAFLFRWGYARYFDIPAELIALDFTDVVHATLVVASVMILSAAVAGPLSLEVFERVETSKSVYGHFARRAIRNVIIGLAFMLLGDLSRKDQWICLGVAILLAAMTTAFELGSVARQSKPSTRILELLRPQFVRVAGWLILAALLIYFGGWCRAVNQRTFFVDRNDSNRVLLAVYGHDTAVFGRLRQEGGPLIKGIIEVQDVRDPDLTLRRVRLSSLD